MARPYSVTITNGTGSENIVAGEYSLSLAATGYDSSTIDPTSITVTNDSSTFDLTVAATGTLTIHVTETGESTGTPVVGAKFYRTDSTGTTYGTEITTDSTGNATLSNVPFDSTNAPTIYFKQTESDGSHNFDLTVQSTRLTAQTGTIEVTNAPAALQTFNLKDANYEGLIVDTANLTLS